MWNIPYPSAGDGQRIVGGRPSRLLFVMYQVHERHLGAVVKEEDRSGTEAWRLVDSSTLAKGY
jgi:hypothetical protein